MNSTSCTLLTKTLTTEFADEYTVDGPFISTEEALVEVMADRDRAVGISMTSTDPLSQMDLMMASGLIGDAVRQYLERHDNPFFETRDKKGKPCDFVYRTKTRTVAMFDRCTGDTIGFHGQDLEDKRYNNLPRFVHITKENIDGLQSMLYFDGQQIKEKLNG